MTRRYWILASLLVLFAYATHAEHNMASAQKKAAAPTAVANEDPRRLAHEVAALQTLHFLQLSPSQLQAVGRICKDTASVPPTASTAKVSAKFRKTMLDLRAALVADQDERVSELNEKLDKLFDDENIELNDRLPISDSARRKAREFVKVLQPWQVASLVADLDEDALDPFERIVETVESGRKLPTAAWQKLRDDVADEIAWLIAGSNIAEAKAAKQKVAVLLDRQRKLSPTAFDANFDALEKEAEALTGQLDPFDVVRHAVERELAELLSNPQLATAIQARLQAAKK